MPLSTFCVFCKRPFDGQICIRRYKTGAKCRTCCRLFDRNPLDLGTEEQRANHLREMNHNRDMQADWDHDVAELESAVPANGKTKGCHSEPKVHRRKDSTSFGDGDEPDHKRGKIVGEKEDSIILDTNMGTFAPTASLKRIIQDLEEEGQELPVIKKKDSVNGQKGVLLDDPKGKYLNYTGCGRLYHRSGDGIKQRKEYVRTENLNNPGDLDDIYKKMEDQQGAKVRPGKKYGNIQTLQVRKREDAVREPGLKSIFDYTWGGKLFSSKGKGSVIEAWEDREAKEASKPASKSVPAPVDKRKAQLSLLKSALDAAHQFFNITIREPNGLLLLTEENLAEHTKMVEEYSKEKYVSMFTGAKVEARDRVEGEELLSEVAMFQTKLQYSAYAQEFLAECAHVTAPVDSFSFTMKSVRVLCSTLASGGLTLPLDQWTELAIRRVAIGHAFHDQWESLSLVLDPSVIEDEHTFSLQHLEVRCKAEVQRITILALFVELMNGKGMTSKLIGVVDTLKNGGSGYLLDKRLAPIANDLSVVLKLDDFDDEELNVSAANLRDPLHPLQIATKGATGREMLARVDSRRLASHRDAKHGATMEAHDIPEQLPYVVGGALGLTCPCDWRKLRDVCVEVQRKASGRFLKTNAKYLAALAALDATKQSLCDGFDMMHTRDVERLSESIVSTFPKLDSVLSDTLQAFVAHKPSAEDIHFEVLCLQGNEDPSFKEFELKRFQSVQGLTALVQFSRLSVDAKTPIEQWDDNSCSVFCGMLARDNADKPNFVKLAEAICTRVQTKVSADLKAVLTEQVKPSYKKLFQTAADLADPTVDAGKDGLLLKSDTTYNFIGVLRKLLPAILHMGGLVSIHHLKMDLVALLLQPAIVDLMGKLVVPPLDIDEEDENALLATFDAEVSKLRSDIVFCCAAFKTPWSLVQTRIGEIGAQLVARLANVKEGVLKNRSLKFERCTSAMAKMHSHPNVSKYIELLSLDHVDLGLVRKFIKDHNFFGEESVGTSFGQGKIETDLTFDHFSEHAMTMGRVVDRPKLLDEIHVSFCIMTAAYALIRDDLDSTDSREHIVQALCTECLLEDEIKLLPKGLHALLKKEYSGTPALDKPC